MDQEIVRRIRRWCVSVATVMAVSLSILPLSSEAGGSRTYKVQGIVIALALTQTPPLIVVKTPLSPNNHMTVGATVTPQTKIMRGQKRVALQTIKVGETVWLTYVKAEGSLFARTIQLKA